MIKETRKETRKEHYKITEFNKRRLQRGEQYCFRADVFINSEKYDWVWLSVKDITEILSSNNCSIEGHDKFKEEITRIKNWDKLWSEMSEDE